MFHLIQGDDEYRISLKRNEIIAGFKKDGSAAIEQYDGKDKSFDLVQLYNAASTQSFFEPRKIITVDRAFDLYDREKSFLKKKGSTILDDILKAGDDVLIILTAHEKPIPRNTTFYKTIEKSGKVVELKKIWYDPNEGLKGELLAFVKRETQKRKLNLTSQQLNLIVTRVGSDLRQIANELDKIVIYLDGAPESNLDSTTLATLIPASRELVIFNLIDAIAAKNRVKALSYLTDLLTSGANESQVIMMIHRQLRLIFSWQLMEKRDVSIADRMKDLGLTSFTSRKVQSQLGAFPVTTLPYSLSTLIKADEEVKSSSLPGKLILEKLIVRLTG